MAGDERAPAARIEREAVVAALNGVADQLAAREQIVPVRAAVGHRDGTSVRRAVEHHRFVGDAAGDQFVAEVAAPRADVPRILDDGSARSRFGLNELLHGRHPPSNAFGDAPACTHRFRRPGRAGPRTLEGKPEIDVWMTKNGSDAWAPISKSAAAWTVRPNMVDYASTCATFSWDVARKEFLGAVRAAGVNIADLAVDRHAEGLLAERVALRFVDRAGTAVEVRFVSCATRRTASPTSCAGSRSGKANASSR